MVCHMNRRAGRIFPGLRMDSLFQFRFAPWSWAVLWVLPFIADAAAAENPSGGLPVLTNLVQVRGLAPAQAKNKYPVTLRGVVTYANPGWFLWFMQDETAGSSIYRQDETGPLRAGQEIELSGHTIQGLSGPAVQSQKIKILGQRAMPEDFDFL